MYLLELCPSVQSNIPAIKTGIETPGEIKQCQIYLCGPVQDPNRPHSSCDIWLFSQVLIPAFRNSTAVQDFLHNLNAGMMPLLISVTQKHWFYFLFLMQNFCERASTLCRYLHVGILQVQGRAVKFSELLHSGGEKYPCWTTIGIFPLTGKMQLLLKAEIIFLGVIVAE